jgi:hypothetical protein
MLDSVNLIFISQQDSTEDEKKGNGKRGKRRERKAITTKS